jgi:hypothetical protein
VCKRLLFNAKWVICQQYRDGIRAMVLNASFNNISVDV